LFFSSFKSVSTAPPLPPSLRGQTLDPGEKNAPSGIAPDPLINLETPTTSNGVTNIYWSYNKNSNPQWSNTATTPQPLSFGNGDNVTVPLGIYSGITISNGATVTLTKGITVISGSGGLVMHGGTLQDNGVGVMIYNTAGSYSPDNGTPDKNDGSTKPTSTLGGGVTIDGGSTINLSPLTSATSPFNGIVFYQRRAIMLP
jgi:hypothetical protein